MDLGEKRSLCQVIHPEHINSFCCSCSWTYKIFSARWVICAEHIYFNNIPRFWWTSKGRRKNKIPRPMAGVLHFTRDATEVVVFNLRYKSLLWYSFTYPHFPARDADNQQKPTVISNPTVKLYFQSITCLNLLRISRIKAWVRID